MKSGEKCSLLPVTVSNCPNEDYMGQANVFLHPQTVADALTPQLETLVISWRCRSRLTSHFLTFAGLHLLLLRITTSVLEKVHVMFFHQLTLLLPKPPAIYGHDGGVPQVQQSRSYVPQGNGFCRDISP